MWICLVEHILQTRHKVLVAAFLRPLKDPFPPARCAGIGAIAATHMYYTTSDIASRLLPALCSLTVDKDKTVRDEVKLGSLTFHEPGMIKEELFPGLQDYQGITDQTGEVF